MFSKSVLIFCASALLSEVLSQCIGREAILEPYGAGWPYNGLAPFDGLGLGPAWPAIGWGAGIGSIASGISTGFGGGLTVISSSPIAPTGLVVTSENAIEGVVAVAGQLPFLGAVMTDGAFATVGAGAVSYGCGDGAVGIVNEVPIAPIAPAYGYGLGLGPKGLAGISPYGECGYGAIY